MKIIKISAIWCPSCILMNNIFNKLKKDFTNIEFIEYDYDFDEDIVKGYNPGEILPVIIFEKEKELERIIGECSYDDIVAIIRRYSSEEDN